MTWSSFSRLESAHVPIARFYDSVCRYILLGGSVLQILGTLGIYSSGGPLDCCNMCAVCAEIAVEASIDVGLDFGGCNFLQATEMSQQAMTVEDSGTTACNASHYSGTYRS